MKITETQIGAISENLVSAELIQKSNGRLSPFHPFADDTGIDLLVYDKLTGEAVPLQIKSRTKALAKHPKILHFQVRDATFDEERHAFLLAVYLKTQGSWQIGTSRLIPMLSLIEVAAKREDRYVIRPSMSPSSKDKYAAYRCNDTEELVTRIITDCEST